MKRKVLFLILTSSMIMLASCGGKNQDSTNAHQPETAWTSNASGHWHKCKCGCDRQFDFSTHHEVMKTDDQFQWGECSDCGFITKSKRPF